jgi:hypothetical protein
LLKGFISGTSVFLNGTEFTPAYGLVDGRAFCLVVIS